MNQATSLDPLWVAGYIVLHTLARSEVDVQNRPHVRFWHFFEKKNQSFLHPGSLTAQITAKIGRMMHLPLELML